MAATIWYEKDADLSVFDGKALRSNRLVRPSLRLTL